jgi:hypothetical protein
VGASLFRSAHGIHSASWTASPGKNECNDAVKRVSESGEHNAFREVFLVGTGLGSHSTCNQPRRG